MMFREINEVKEVIEDVKKSVDFDPRKPLFTPDDEDLIRHMKLLWTAKTKEELIEEMRG